MLTEQEVKDKLHDYADQFQMQNHWLWQWQKNDWQNARGKTVGNVDVPCAWL